MKLRSSAGGARAQAALDRLQVLHVQLHRRAGWPRMRSNLPQLVPGVAQRLTGSTCRPPAPLDGSRSSSS